MHEESTTAHHDHLGQHSRTLALVANVPQHVFSVSPDRDSPTTWLINATNSIDGTQPEITLTCDHTGPNGVLLPIVTQIGPRESVQLYLTGAVNITALAVVATTLEISITAIGGGLLSVPPLRHTETPGAVAFLALSANNGYAPPGRRYFTVYSTVAFDLQMRNQGGAVTWSAAALPLGAPAGPFILPPGLRLLGKGNVAAATISTAWTQTRGN